MATWLMIFSYIRWQIMIHLINCQYHLFDLWSPYWGLFSTQQKGRFLWKHLTNLDMFIFWAKKCLFYFIFSLCLFPSNSLDLSLTLLFYLCLSLFPLYFLLLLSHPNNFQSYNTFSFDLHSYMMQSKFSHLF